ncbi:MAG: alpha/beta hydrolase [Desulfatibacillaceae bacterium]
MATQRTNSDFHSRGTRCAGWLYMPEATNPPVVVMAHGFGGQRNFRLPAFASRFAQRNMAVFLFDYRTFGDSGGHPRHMVNPFAHLEDWRAALEHVRAIPGVDTGRIGLWGTSFSGGHVVVTAANDHGVRAVVSQVPFVDGLASARMFPASHIARCLYHGLKDIARMATARPPHYVPLVGEPDEFAALNTPGCMEGFRSIVPNNERFENRVAARALMYLTMYRPIHHAHKVKCPTLVVSAEQDNLIPAHAVADCALRMPRGELLRRNVGHFDVYTGKEFNEVVKHEADFFVRHLKG